MSHQQDRDAALDRLLRRGPGPSPEPTRADACLDAETLAAWIDGELGAAARRAAETHASQCARCQAILAVMVQHADAVGVPRMEQATGLAGFRRSLRWLVPLTGGALAATVWLLVAPHVESPVQPVAPVLIDRAEEQGGTADSAAKPAEERAAVPPERKDESGARESRARDVAAPGAAAKQERQAADARRKLAKVEAAETVAVRSAPAAPPPATASAPPSGRPARAEGVAASSPALGNLAFRAATAPVVIEAPDPSIRWRIMGQSVEHSRDGGATWTGQFLPKDVVLIAGSAPSATVCWLVGRAGVVLLTTDARTWQRIAFPDPVDLTTVHATDERTATVQGADGRSFQTADGGQTWRH